MSERDLNKYDLFNFDFASKNSDRHPFFMISKRAQRRAIRKRQSEGVEMAERERKLGILRKSRPQNIVDVV